MLYEVITITDLPRRDFMQFDNQVTGARIALQSVSAVGGEGAVWARFAQSLKAGATMRRERGYEQIDVFFEPTGFAAGGALVHGAVADLCGRRAGPVLAGRNNFV